MKKMDGRKVYLARRMWLAGIIVLAVLIFGSQAGAVVPPPVQPDGPPATDANKTVTMDSDGNFTCGPDYVLAPSGKGCVLKVT